MILTNPDDERLEEYLISLIANFILARNCRIVGETEELWRTGFLVDSRMYLSPTRDTRIQQSRFP